VLILAQGELTEALADEQLAALHAWFGPMVDDGFLQGGYVSAERRHVWMFVAAPDFAAVRQRMNDLPLVADGTIKISLTAVTALRFR
jgi:hypothetical protein